MTAIPRVLIAEDDATLRDLMVAVLRDDLGARVDAVPDGQAAVAALAASAYAVVVLDLLMPGADGFAVLRWLATRPPHLRVPAIVCSAVSEGHREAAIRLGAAACVAKPFDVDDLVSAVRPFVDGPVSEAAS